jgi:hypothetical protein
MDGPRTSPIRDNLTNADAMNLSAGPRYPGDRRDKIRGPDAVHSNKKTVIY